MPDPCGRRPPSWRPNHLPKSKATLRDEAFSQPRVPSRAYPGFPGALCRCAWSAALSGLTATGGPVFLSPRSKETVPTFVWKYVHSLAMRAMRGGSRPNRRTGHFFPMMMRPCDGRQQICSPCGVMKCCLFFDVLVNKWFQILGP